MNDSQLAVPDSGVPPVDAAAIARIAGKSIFFAHQSVGSNILQGVSDLTAGLSGASLRVVEGTNIDAAGGLYHSPVGRNGHPLSKIEGFAALLRNDVGDRADVAFFKMCYVDFGPRTDVQLVFDRYRETMVSLQAEYPNTRFVHVTVPLTARERGLKTAVKGVLGRPRRGYQDNLVRERFNRLMRQEYADSGLLFDLARVESTLPDGTRLRFEQDGEPYYALVPEYTSDGGHLSELGRRQAAAELLSLLASLE